MADTLLDMVQDILVEIEGDAVNSISDTEEAMSVARTIRSAFKDIVEEQDIPSRKDLIALEGLADVNKPNFMKIPDNVQRISWIKYDCRLAAGDNKAYRDVVYMEPLDFVDYVNSRPSTDTTTYQVVQYSSNLPLVIHKKAAPRFWTTFDNTYIVFDSFNVDIDSTLQASKSMTEGYVRPTMTLTDTTVPNLPENLSRLLYKTALKRCFVNMKTTVNPDAEQGHRQMKVRSQRNKWRQGRTNIRGPNYGRK